MLKSWLAQCHDRCLCFTGDCVCFRFKRGGLPLPFAIQLAFSLTQLTPATRRTRRIFVFQLASYLHCNDADLVLVENASSGCNAVLRSLQYERGDYILFLSTAYGMVKNTAVCRVAVVAAVVCPPRGVWSLRIGCDDCSVHPSFVTTHPSRFKYGAVLPRRAGQPDDCRGWLIDWLVGWLVGWWLVGWLVGWFFA